MSSPLGDLVVKISTDTRALHDGLKSSTTAVNSFAKSMKGVLATLGVAFAAREVIQYGKHIIELGDELNSLSKRTGLAASELAELRFVASQSDTSLGALTGSFRFLAKNMDEAAQGSEKATELFERFHIEFKNSDGTLRNYKDVLLEVADRIKNTSDQSTVMAATTQLLGRSSAELIPLLRQGSAEIKRLTDRYKELGGTPDEINELAKSADEMKDAWDEVSKTFEIVGIKIMKELVPHLKRMGEELVKIDFKPFIDFMAGTVENGVGVLKWFDNLTSKIVALANAFTLLFDKTATFSDLKAAMDGEVVVTSGMKPSGGMNRSAILDGEDTEKIAASRKAIIDQYYGGVDPGPGTVSYGPDTSNLFGLKDDTAGASGGLGTGIDAPKPDEKIEETKTAMQDLAAAWADVNTQIQEGLATTLTMIAEGFGSALADVIVDGKDFGEAMKELWKSIAKEVIAQITAMIVKQMLLFAWQVLTGTVGTGKGASRFLSMREGGAIGARNGMVYGAQGFATGPFGEAGIPAVIHPNEIVTPIDKFFDVIKAVGKGNTTVNINGYNQDPKALSDLVALEIERERRNV